jgi:hypothetical protein
METGNTRLDELYAKWFNKTATPQEKADLIELLQVGASKEELAPAINTIWDQLQEDQSFSLHDKQQLADKILKQWPAESVEGPVAPIIRFRWTWAAAAAILLMVGSVFVWKMLTDKRAFPPKEYSTVPRQTEPILPGTNGAILTLSDGRRIVLDSTTNGIIGNQGNAQISLQNNQVMYKAGSATATDTAMAYNTMSTPKGRQFQLVLPDGSKVWLNAASSITYPIAFRNKERRVEISGEAYFEVAHDKTKPFIVQTSNQQVQALGTSFNVYAYENEELEKTTLLEGSVRVNAIDNNPTRRPRVTTLIPGQEARINNSVQLLFVADNVGEAAIAWKNGYFNLENIPFDQVMKQLERWYDIQVVYEKGVPNLRFVGGLSRNMTLESLIRALKVSEVHFKVEAGRKLVVYK